MKVFELLRLNIKDYQNEIPSNIYQQFKSFFSQGKKPENNFADLLESKASIGDPESVISFLREKGIPIEIEIQGSPDAIYSASVFAAIARWKVQGKITRIRLNNDQIVPGVSMIGANNECPEEIKIFRSGEEGDKLIFLPTKEEGVSFVLLDSNNKRADNLYNRFKELILKGEDISHSYLGVVFPMIDFQWKGVISELNGLIIKGYQIQQAEGYLSLRMNEVGGQAKAAAALSAIKSLPELLVIREPFFVGVLVDNELAMAVPIDYSNMKDPGNIGDFSRGEKDSISLY
ncbi:MAG: hypothetical protein NZL96_02040 [Patescibacteria group bacterium]|nr:hypothetical protein [Patescibacteria group bacterium]